MPVISLGRIEDAHEKGVWAITKLGNGRFLSGGLDGALKLWQLGAQERGPVDAAPSASAQEGDTATSTSAGGKVAELVAHWPQAHHLAVTSLDSVPAQNLAVSTGFDGRIRVWKLDATTPEQAALSEHQLNPLEAFQVAVSAGADSVAIGGDVFAGASQPQRICLAALYRLPLLEKAHSLEVERDARLEQYRFTTCVRFAASAATTAPTNMLLCGGNNGTLVAVDINTEAWDCVTLASDHQSGASVSEIKSSGLPVRALAQTKKEPSIVFCASEDECIHVVDWRMCEEASIFATAGSGPLFAVTVTEEEPVLVFAAGADGQVRAYDRRSGECVYTQNAETRKAIWSLESIDREGLGAPRIVLGGDDGYLEVLKA